MDMLTRRSLLRNLSALPLLGAGVAHSQSQTQTGTAGSLNLKSITGNAQPISPAERRTRVAKLQSLLSQQKIGALLVESGSTLDYFTGIQWRRSERMTPRSYRLTETCSW